VPARDIRLQRRHKKGLFAGAYAKPSDGLEPSTPSLPFSDRGGKREHGRVIAATKVPQADGI
jgi:hypothetical protein